MVRSEGSQVHKNLNYAFHNDLIESFFSGDIDADSVDDMSPRRLSCMTWQGLVSWLVGW